jgi:hypothetical protein
MTSFASVTHRLQKVIVHAVLRVQQCRDECRETQQRSFTQLRALHDLHLGSLGQHHPHWDLQTPLRRVADADRAIAPLGSAEDPEGNVMQRMERVEDPDVRAVCAQGTEGASASTRISTAWSPAAP